MVEYRTLRKVSRAEEKAIQEQRQYDSNKEYVLRILTHYLRMATERSGGQWDLDNDAEVAGMIESLVVMMERIREGKVTV